jgi:hypothetical protein
VLAGLSRNIRARKLTLVGEAVSDQTEEQKDQLCAAVSVVSMSQLLRHVVDLTLKVGLRSHEPEERHNALHDQHVGCIFAWPASSSLQSMHLDVEAALHLSPLLHGIEALHLQGCYANRSLAVLGNCRHLEQLSLVNTQLAAGAAEALHVLAAEGSPGLQLTLDHVKGSQPSSVVAALAPCVSHLDVKTTTIQELRAVLNTAVQKQCPRLQHIHLSTTEGGHLSLPLMGIRQLATACPQLHSLTCPRIVLPSMHCLRALLEMPQLQQLTINSARDSDELAAFIRWPPGKMPMSLHMERITPSEMAALPLEFCSDMLARFLYIPPGHTRLQLAEGMRAALLNAAKCPQVQVHVIRGSIPILGEQLAPGAGLSALAAGCPLQPRHREEASLLFLALEAEDIQGLAAAWGTSLKYLGLTNCTLSASAWAALAAAHLPALETINLWSIQDAQQLAAHLVAFFLAWPSTRNLRVKVPEDVATQWLSTWSDILQAHQRHNIQLVAA